MRPLSVSQWVSERFIVSEIAIAPSSFQACMNIVMIVSTDYRMNHHAHSKTTQTDIFPLYTNHTKMINAESALFTMSLPFTFLCEPQTDLWVTFWCKCLTNSITFFFDPMVDRVLPDQKVNREQSWTANCPSVCLCIFALSRLVWPISWEHQLSKSLSSCFKDVLQY